MAEQGGCHSEMITQLLRHVTSTSHDADAKGDIFRRTIHAPSLLVIALAGYIFGVTEKGGGAALPPPGRRRPKKSLV